MHRNCSGCWLPRMWLVFLSSSKYSSQQLVYIIYLLNNLVPKKYRFGPSLNYPRCQIHRYRLMRSACVKNRIEMHVYCGLRPSLLELTNSELSAERILEVKQNMKLCSLWSKTIKICQHLSFLLQRLGMKAVTQVCNNPWKASMQKNEHSALF